jgi:transcriptional regulator with XRE-family HTH domain
VPTSWPFEEFREYLRALMDRAGIADYAELSRLTNVSQTQFSNWRRGLSQPSRQALQKIAPVLGLNGPANLYVAAGLVVQEDLQVTAHLDFTVLPRVFDDLRDVYEQMKDIGQGEVVLSSIRVLVAGLRAQLPSTGTHPPSGRGRRAG